MKGGHAIQCTCGMFLPKIFQSVQAFEQKRERERERLTASVSKFNKDKEIRSMYAGT